jgi:hypothetical protein
MESSATAPDIAASLPRAPRAERRAVVVDVLAEALLSILQSPPSKSSPIKVVCREVIDG